MSNYIAGYIYGQLIGEGHLLGTFLNAGFMGDLKNITLLNDNTCDCNINGTDIIGKLTGKYNNGITSGDIAADFVGKIQSDEISESDEIINEINKHLAGMGLKSHFVVSNNNIIYVNENGERILLDINRKQFVDEPKTGIFINVVKDCAFYTFSIYTLDKNNKWNVPINSMVKFSVLCELTNLSIVPVDEIPDPYDFYYILKKMRQEEQKQLRYRTKPKPANNLFTPYTTFTPPANKYFNNAYGEKLGLVHNINPNEILANNYYYVFANSENNTSHGSQNGSTIVMTNEQTKIFDRIYNYEKYHQYKLKIDINGMSEAEKMNTINLYSKSYKLDVIHENGIIYGIYIVY